MQCKGIGVAMRRDKEKKEGKKKERKKERKKKRKKKERKNEKESDSCQSKVNCTKDKKKRRYRWYRFSSSSENKIFRGFF